MWTNVRKLFNVRWLSSAGEYGADGVFRSGASPLAAGFTMHLAYGLEECKPDRRLPDFLVALHHFHQSAGIRARRAPGRQSIGLQGLQQGGNGLRSGDAQVL